jgi:hypothetical protein
MMVCTLYLLVRLFINTYFVQFLREIDKNSSCFLKSEKKNSSATQINIRLLLFVLPNRCKNIDAFTEK